MLQQMLSRLSTVENAESLRKQAEISRAEAEKLREQAIEKIKEDTTKLISDTKKEIAEYKNAKDLEINNDLAKYKQDTTQSIDNYKSAKDTEINNILSEYKTNTTKDIDTFKITKSLELDDFKNTKNSEMRITNGGNLVDIEKAIVVLAIIKPSGKVASQFVEVENGLVYADLKPNMRDEIGIYTAQAMLILEDERVVTDVISYEVEEDKIFSLLNDTVEATEEFTLLTDMLSRLSTIEASEEQRIVNEAERILSEENRKIEEAKRVEAELNRQYEEADRSKYEATRESNENIRKLNEVTRQTNEEPSMCDLVGNYQAKAMIVLEGEIVTTDTINYSVNEDKIISKLNDDVVSDERFPLFTDALARLSDIEASEEQRIVNEAERILSEENRKIEEAKRVEAELIRQHEEADRTKYDATRESNENTRKQNESIRLANEANRIDEETKRVEEENKRKLAEEERKDNYNFMTEDEYRRRSEANAHKVAENLRVHAGNNCIIEGNKFIDSNIILNNGSNTEIKNNNIHISIHNAVTLKAVQVRSSKECRIVENTIDFRGSNIVNINFVALQYEGTIGTLVRGNNFYRPSNITGGNNVEYDVGCIKSENRVMNNYINDNFSENGENLFITKTLTSSINTTSKKIITLTHNLAGKGHPQTIVEVDGVCRKGNTPKYISAKVYFSNYDIANGTPIIVQTEHNSQYGLEIIKELVDGKYSYTIKIKDEYDFDSGMKKVVISQVIPINIDTNNYFIIN